MSKTKRYYWLKLKEDFFKQKEIKKLRRIAGGDTFTIIYLKMLLLSIKNEGKIYFEGVEDDFADELALELDEEIDNIKMTLSYLSKHTLIEVCGTDEYLLPKSLEIMGSEVDSAERVRRHRETKELQCNAKMLQSNPNVTNCNTEIEIELEIELEKDIDIEQKNKIPYKDIVDYLNLKAEKEYKHNTKATQDKIAARWKEGFSLTDFKKAIDNKVAEWKGTDMEKFLRPETLFGTKFESYKNQTIKEKFENKENLHKTKFHTNNNRLSNYTKEELNDKVMQMIRKKQEEMVGRQ
jgi:uncharacterized phage protein (TIGR02220 family)/predicted phage replisome organizer